MKIIAKFIDQMQQVATFITKENKNTRNITLVTLLKIGTKWWE